MFKLHRNGLLLSWLFCDSSYLSSSLWSFNGPSLKCMYFSITTFKYTIIISFAAIDRSKWTVILKLEKKIDILKWSNSQTATWAKQTGFSAHVCYWMAGSSSAGGLHLIWWSTYSRCILGLRHKFHTVWPPETITWISFCSPCISARPHLWPHLLLYEKHIVVWAS